MAVRIDNLAFRWSPGGPAVLDIPELEIADGAQVLITGPSGSGKTSLLNILSGITLPNSGNVEILNTDMRTLSAAARDAFRADHIGVIFQMFNLIPYLSVTENVMLACTFSAARRDRAAGAGGITEQAHRLLTSLGLAPDTFGSRRVDALSIGQQQRVAAARALIGNPGLVIADEPTSALDAANRQSFIDLVSNACRDCGATLIVVSHDEALFPFFDHRIDMTSLNARALSGEPIS
ncbi:MAG: ATP-binding cassette domain-containing protein [Rhodospirillales bacterium]|nr:ATP-binding cassette domain-containing protein [Rhodospirillales bacterium]MBO6786073.1 ATP-binding cassette domain-containing protein [Rhodospirillales bacterium]